MLRSRRKPVAAALAAVLALTLTACAQEVERTSSGLIKVTYASFAGPSGLPAKFGKEKGFFEEQGLDVTFVEGAGPGGPGQQR
ncbi:ABC transporter substrate-binding protein [Prauserella sp. PE36]|uniref:ABC transporter substrate-binding protein n=1 Tax=Prauserella sp. PE36 TaxID=1504709 RepID=UPI0018F4174D|nr:ABC transporter substrate-binding protein [Prauserella sp. PE36]